MPRPSTVSGPWARRGAAWLASVLGSATLPAMIAACPELSLVGRRCDAQRPCGDDLVCVNGRCSVAGPTGDGDPGDAGPDDAGRADAGSTDAGPDDAGRADAGSMDAGPDDAGSADAGPALALIVAPQFPVTGEGWNDYVQNDADTPADASGAPCGTLVDAPPQSCLHGGERRVVAIPGATTCAGLALTDVLGAFTWSCADGAGGVRFLSDGLVDDRALADLLDGAVWRENHVVLTGALAGESAPAAWWDNPVVALPFNGGPADAVALLDMEGAVYTATGPVITQGYNVTADKVAVAVQGDRVMRYGGSGVPNVGYHGEVNTEAFTVLGSYDRRFLWIEGTFDADSSIDAIDCIRLGYQHQARLRRVTAKNGFNAGIHIVESRRVWLDDVAILNSGADVFIAGLLMVDDAFSLVTDLRASRVRRGVQLESSTDIAFSRVTLDNCGFDCFVENSNARVAVTFLTTAAAAFGGVLSFGSADTTYAGITVAHSRDGVLLGRSSSGADLTGAVLHLAAGLNNAEGVGLERAQRTTLSQVAVLDNTAPAVTAVADVADVAVRGALLVGSGAAATCSVLAGATGVGLADGTCTAGGADGGADFPTPSTATLRTGRTSATAVVGRLAGGGANDPVNTSETGGAADFPAEPALFDWGGFAAHERAWGIEVSAYPSAAARGMWTVDVGRIWDWRLRAADTVLRGTTGDGATQAEPFVVGAPCPASAHGDRATTSLRTPPDTYLLAAIELVEDSTGDNDGLCESNERCVFAPSFGAYQGEGALIGPCVFTDGAVAAVTLLAHPTPGAP